MYKLLAKVRANKNSRIYNCGIENKKEKQKQNTHTEFPFSMWLLLMCNSVWNLDALRFSCLLVFRANKSERYTNWMHKLWEKHTKWTRTKNGITQNKRYVHKRRHQPTTKWVCLRCTLIYRCISCTEYMLMYKCSQRWQKQAIFVYMFVTLHTKSVFGANSGTIFHFRDSNDSLFCVTFCSQFNR